MICKRKTNYNKYKFNDKTELEKYFLVGIKPFLTCKSGKITKYEYTFSLHVDYHYFVYPVWFSSLLEIISCCSK